MPSALREDHFEASFGPPLAVAGESGGLAAERPALRLVPGPAGPASVEIPPLVPARLAARAAVERGLDVVVAVVALLVLAPLFALVALAIRIDSRGPVFYRQRRVGRDGREFAMWKFRTMVDRAHELRDSLAHLNEAADGLFKISDDPRRTRVGRLLRRVCLDELPQLLDVLAGRMSLVGPRPLVPEEDALVPGHLRRRLAVRPGITGAWQATGDHSVSIAEMAAIDVDYVDRRSVLGDLRIVAATAAHILSLRGK